MQSKKNSIMVVDDHPLIHDGLKNLLTSEPDIEITAEAYSATEAKDKLKETQPDLIIIDLSLSDSDGTYLVQRLKVTYPEIRLLVYSMSEEKLFAGRTADAGADGYVMKTSSPDILKEAIRALLAGEQYFPEDIMTQIKNRKTVVRTKVDCLSNREMDIFNLIGQGLDTVDISEKLNISRNTVDTHRINIKNKLELLNGKALDRYAYEVIQQRKLPD